jgi:hypothetical protein
MKNLLLLLPEEALPLIGVVLLLAVVAGLARPRLLLGFVVFVALLPLIGLLVVQVIDALPWWLVALIFGGIAISIIRAALSVLIGTSAANNAVGALAADAIKAVLRMTVLPIRLLAWFSRR